MNGLPLLFGNPWGLLALLGLPAVVAIHCLQQKSPRIPVSTLFLLERLAPDSREGRRLAWLRASAAFWLQILCVLLLTWLLVDPRWVRASTVQRVVLVLDSSISMRAFTGDMVARLAAPLRAVAALAPQTYWTVLETDPARPTLYEGTSLSGLEQKIGAWSPALPANDPSHALALARALAPGGALVVFVTDRPRDVPTGVDLIAIGEPLENCGLVGLRLTGTGDALEWQILAQNYGTQPAHRSWWLEFSGKRTDPAALDFAPGHPQLLHGTFPPGVDRLTVCLAPDRFAVDDRMPIVRPRPKQLVVRLQGDAATNDLFARLVQTLPSLVVAAGRPTDLAFATLGPTTSPPATDVSSVILYDNPGGANGGFLGGPFVADNDPLNQDLDWQGLVIQPGPALPASPDRHVLLWKDDLPLIYVRLLGDRRQLVFNFNFTSSNAARLPAFVLLIERFADSLRLEKKEPETVNAELAEPLEVAADPTGSAVQLHGPDGTDSTVAAGALVPLRAPSLPGFFTVDQDARTWLTGAAGFADARESDFRTAATLDTVVSRRAKLVEMHTRGDALTSFWLVLIGALLLLYWTAASPRNA